MDYTQHPVVNGVEQQQQYSVTSLLGPILWHTLTNMSNTLIHLSKVMWQITYKS